MPIDTAAQWTIFCYIIFNVVKDKVCRKSFSGIAMTVSDTFGFGMTTKHARIISNILLNNYVSQETPRSTKEPALKRLKLSTTS